ncbi:hypothetical protein G6N76_22990 [Rhizobium daejeonense]|uniref:Transmembrane anchor protein n=1 Tax=Rhizobium daejeonense TaxID=240521 RepID=A0A6M1SE32_9HYPH|nr:hypothetical protein [Rhizobium daejeonense]NGO66538.1 hypothetical protein [Rhizobium daejeonense]HCL67739.1 hypothetical protein [Rhizobium sp.]
MYNTDFPSRADLPTLARLKRSTLIAAAAAGAILVTIVLPSEYAIDPTGVGRVLGLVEMGEIKTQLAAENAKDKAATTVAPLAGADGVALAASLVKMEQRLASIEAMLANNNLAIVGPSTDEIARLAQQTGSVSQESDTTATLADPNEAEALPAEVETQTAALSEKNDEITITLDPGQGAEVKLVMDAGAKAAFEWAAENGVLNFDAHGDGGGQSVSYEKGRGVESDSGELEAAFKGNHGWFWRNRGNTPVTFTLRTRGAYAEMKRVS